MNFLEPLCGMSLMSRLQVIPPMRSGPQLLRVEQNAQEIQRFGDLVQIGANEMIAEYRSLLINTNNVIPIMRARCDDYNEVIPLGAIRKREGYLLHGGMHIDSHAEFEKLCVAF